MTTIPQAHRPALDSVAAAAVHGLAAGVLILALCVGSTTSSGAGAAAVAALLGIAAALCLAAAGVRLPRLRRR